MGWARTLLLGDIGNRLDIGDVEGDVAVLRQKIAGAYRNDATLDERLHELAAENAELKLYLAALIRLLISKGTISKQEIQSLVAAVDFEDGRTDGRCDGKVVS
jgi:hypothetical protein